MKRKRSVALVLMLTFLAALPQTVFADDSGITTPTADGSTRAQAITVTYDTEIAGTSTSDGVWYKFPTAAKSAYYTVELVITGQGKKLGVECQMFDGGDNPSRAKKKILAYDSESMKTMTAKLTADASGYLNVVTGSLYNDTTYTLKVSFVLDTGDTRATAKTVKMKKIVSDTFNDDTSDVDWFRFKTANYEAVYSVTFYPTDEYAYSGSVYDAAGGKVASQYVYKTSSVVTVKLPKNKTCYVCCSADLAKGEYSFQIKPIRDIGDTFKTAVTLNMGKTKSSKLDCKGDVDVLKVKATETRQAKVIVTNKDVDSYFYYEVYNPSKTRIKRATVATGKKGSCKVDMKKGKTYYIKIYDTSTYTGGYSVKVKYVSP